MIDIPKLITELERAGDGWAYSNFQPSHYSDLCRRAALALKEQRGEPMREVMHRLGLVLIELGKKLTGDGHA